MKQYSTITMIFGNEVEMEKMQKVTAKSYEKYYSSFMRKCKKKLRVTGKRIIRVKVNIL